MNEEECAFAWAYLSKRKQRVKVPGCTSDWLELLKGVLRGRSWGRHSSTSATITRSSHCNYADDNTVTAIGDTKQDDNTVTAIGDTKQDDNTVTAIGDTKQDDNTVTAIGDTTQMTIP